MPNVTIICRSWPVGFASCPCGVGENMAINSNILIYFFRSFRVPRGKFPSKFFKVARRDGLARSTHSAQVHVQVVPRQQPQPEDFTRAKQMSNVCPRKIAARMTFAPVL